MTSKELQNLFNINHKIPLHEKITMILSNNIDYGCENGGMISVSQFDKTANDILTLFGKDIEPEKIKIS